MLKAEVTFKMSYSYLLCLRMDFSVQNRERERGNNDSCCSQEESHISHLLLDAHHSHIGNAPTLRCLGFDLSISKYMRGDV